MSLGGARRSLSLGEDSSSCRSSELEQGEPKPRAAPFLARKAAAEGGGLFGIFSPRNLLKYWRKDDISMTKVERSKYIFIYY